MLEGLCYRPFNTKNIFSNGGIIEQRMSSHILDLSRRYNPAAQVMWRWRGRLILSLPITSDGLQISFRPLGDQRRGNSKPSQGTGSSTEAQGKDCIR